MKTAIVVTADEKLWPGINAILNSLRYYGNDCELHLLLWGDTECAEYFKHIALTCPEANLKVIRLDLYVPNITRRPVYYLKFWRHIYVANELMDYDAVAIFDADMCVTNNIMDYFDIAASTGKILIPRNASGLAQQVETYNQKAFQDAYAPPLYSMPLFYKPALYSGYFKQIPQVGLKLGHGEMVAVNWVILKSDLLKQTIIMPNCQWVQTAWKEYLLSGHTIADKRYLSIARDRLNAIHGRWWAQSTIDRYMDRTSRDEQVNVKLFLETYRFFNSECQWKLDWKWGKL